MIVRGAFAALTAAASLAMASPALAGSVFVQSATLLDSQVYGLGSDGWMGNMSPFVVTASEGMAFDPGNQFTVLAFCIDYYTPMPGDGTIATQYEDAAPPAPFDFAKINALIYVGTNIYNSALQAHGGSIDITSDDGILLSRELSAIQAAIWTTNTLTVTSPMGWDPDLDDRIGFYLDSSNVAPPPASATLRTIFADQGSAQGLGYSMVLSVPEPATWGLMLLGFFSVGTSIRVARRRSAPAAL